MKISNERIAEIQETLKEVHNICISAKSCIDCPLKFEKDWDGEPVCFSHLALYPAQWGEYHNQFLDT